MHDTVEKLRDFIPLLVTLMPVDCIISLTDTEKVIAGHSTVQIEGLAAQSVGQPIDKESPCYKAMKEQKIIYIDIPKEILGTAFRTTGIPLKDQDGVIIGSILLGISLEDKQTLEKTAETVAQSTQQISHTTNGIATASNRLASEVANLADAGQKVGESLKQTDGILAFINEIAVSSNLLGLNASIEAARAGEQGRGFGVVAAEIRKMADNSAESVKSIAGILNSIKSESILIRQKVDDLLVISSNLASGVQEIASSMEDLSGSTNNIRNVASNLYTKNNQVGSPQKSY